MGNSVFEHLSDPNDVMEKLFQIGSDKTIYYVEVTSENPFVFGNKFDIHITNIARQCTIETFCYI